MIGIIGSGTMGKGIAIEFARNSHKVILVSAERHLPQETLYSEVERITEKYNFENQYEIIKNITTSNKFSDLSNCDLIIEAVSEDIEKKRNILYEMKKYTKEACILATNTSSLSVKDIFNNIYSLNKVVGLHFFNPVQVMKLVELSYLEETENETIVKINDLISSLNKEVVLVKNSPGFIVNRLLIPMINEAAKIVDEGIATIEDVDRAMKYGANHPMGPMRLSDLIGNDITLAILRELRANNCNIEISTYLIKLVEQSKLGRKSNEGFYKYIK